MITIKKQSTTEMTEIIAVPFMMIQGMAAGHTVTSSSAQTVILVDQIQK